MVNSSENNASSVFYDVSHLHDDEILKNLALTVFNSQRENLNDILKNHYHEDKIF